MGNLRSVSNAFDHIRAPYFVATRPEQLDDADKILLPGVGAFRNAMTLLEQSRFRVALDEHVQVRKKPLLGICLGMQLLAENGTEFGDCGGLGYVSGCVKIIPRTDKAIRLPQIGWNELSILTECPLLKGVNGDDGAYFVHSYYLKATRVSEVSSVCEYGSSLTSSISAGHIFGMQFHPEKSQLLGLHILKNFAEL